MDFRILGPLEVLREGERVTLGGSKQRALLAVLLLHANETLSTHRLVDELWGDPPATAAKTVQVHVSRLRKALAASSGDGADGVVVTREGGYELRLEPEHLDVHRFEDLVAEGRRELSAERPGRAVAALERALSLWRGPPLAEFSAEPFAQREIPRLEELEVEALEQLIEAKLALGGHAEIVGQLETLVRTHPYRERLRMQLMLALYRSDRQADALQAYQEARRSLVEDLGIEPGARLRDLERMILAQDPALALPVTEPAGLPAELDASGLLAGRAADLAWLREHWRRVQGGDGRLVTVVGPPGMGKTRLAAELASEVSGQGAGVKYASGPHVASLARAVRSAARRSGLPALVVLDDVDRGGDDLPAAVSELVEALADVPVLAVATAEDEALAARLPAAATLVLRGLDADGLRAVAELHAGRHAEADVPVDRLAEASGGVPEQAHLLASEWARKAASGRLALAARRAAAERTDLRSAEDALAADVVELQELRRRAGRVDGERAFVPCPFKGLAPFDEGDAAVFFGRERLVAEMVARLAGAPLMGIVGPSGSGKSSALRAGLLAELAAGVLPGSEGYAIALLRPGAHPLQALEQATADATGRGRVVVAVDQFEETFTACGDPGERSRFMEALVSRARDPRRPALVLVAVRADFYGRCAEHPELSRLLGANHVLVGPMRRDEFRRAIELPARHAGLEVEPELTEALLADVEGEAGALPLLSTALLELWQHRDGRRLRLNAYQLTGGVHGAVARLAENAYGRLDRPQREVARQILMRLAGDGQGEAVVRRRVPLTELEGDGVAAVVRTLADARLVTVGEGEIEVAHEALLREWPRLRRWLEEDAQGRRLHRHLGAAAREWEAGGRDPSELYRGARLAAALDWSAGHATELSAGERAFLAASRAMTERSQRRLRAVLGGVAALLVLALVAGFVALEQRGDARAEALAADAQRLGARALAENDLDVALLLARQGVALDNSMQTRGNLLASLVRSPAAIGTMRGAGERMWALELSPDARTLAAGDPAGNLFLFDTRTQRRVATINPADGVAWIVALAYSPDGRRLAIAHDTPRGNVVALLDTATRRIVRVLRPPPQRFARGLRWSPDGRRLDTLAVGYDPEAGPALLTRFDVRTGRRVRGPRAVNLRGSSPLLATGDGRRLITAGEDEVTVRNAATLRVLQRRTIGGGDSASSPSTFALGPDDRTLAIGDEDGSVRFLDLATGTVRTATGRHGGAVAAAQFAPDGRTLVTGGEDGEVIVSDVAEAAPRETLSGHANGVQALSVSRDGRTLYTAGLDGVVMAWDLGGARRLGRPFTAGAGDEDRPQLAVSDDEAQIAMGQDDGAVSIVDARTLAGRRTWPVVDTGQVGGIGFVPGRHLLVVGGPEGFLALLDTDSGRVTARLRGHDGFVFTPGLSADGRLLATADDSTVQLWSLPDGRPTGTPLRFRNVEAVALSPDGRRLVVVLVDDDFENGTIEVWDVRERRRVRAVRVADFPGLARFSPDGRLLAVGLRTAGTQLWSTTTWEPVAQDFAGDASGIIAAQVSPDGRTLATGSDTGIVQLWDVETGQALGAPLPGVPSRPSAPYFVDDGARLIASFDTGQAYLWDIRPASHARHACAVAGRRLTREEWAEFLPDRPYRPAC